METIKRAYAKPTILKIQLSHEQAVLGTCSTAATSGSSGSQGRTGPLSCARMTQFCRTTLSTAQGADSTATS